MATQKHTPTPWTYFVGNADGRGLIRIEADAESSAAGAHVASMARGPLGEANAAFITRAVNAHARLVAALTELADAVDEEQTSDPDMPSHTDTVDRLERAVEAARAALKAAGEP